METLSNSYIWMMNDTRIFKCLILKKIRILKKHGSYWEKKDESEWQVKDVDYGCWEERMIKADLSEGQEKTET